jgi:hypothetical protein
LTRSSQFTFSDGFSSTPINTLTHSSIFSQSNVFTKSSPFSLPNAFSDSSVTVLVPLTKSNDCTQSTFSSASTFDQNQLISSSSHLYFSNIFSLSSLFTVASNARGEAETSSMVPILVGSLFGGAAFMAIVGFLSYRFWFKASSKIHPEQSSFEESSPESSFQKSKSQQLEDLTNTNDNISDESNDDQAGYLSIDSF